MATPSFLELTRALRGSVLQKLVTSEPCVSLGVLRLLPEVTRAVLMRLVALPSQSAVRLADVEHWLRAPKEHALVVAKTLTGLRLVESSGDGRLWLNKDVLAALQQGIFADAACPWQRSLLDASAPQSQPAHLTALEATTRTVAAELDARTRERLTALQEFVVSRGDCGVQQQHTTAVPVPVTMAVGRSPPLTTPQPAPAAPSPTPATTTTYAQSSTPVPLERSEPPGVTQLLAQAGLFDRTARGSLLLNSAGFQFLLADIRAQVCALLSACVGTRLRSCPPDAPKKARKQARKQAASVLSLVYRFMFLAPLRPYSAREMDATQREALGLFDELCLVKYDPAAQVFWPSTLLIDSLTLGNLNSAEEQAQQDQQDQQASERGKVIVEPNGHVYGYALTPLEESLLKIFCDNCHALPGGGFFVAELTRSSINRALSRGITCQQIAQFLHVNAHPQCIERRYVLPENIVDQMRLWEDETRYVTQQLSYYAKSFASTAHYVSARDAARAAGGLLWHDDRNQSLVVAPRAFNAIRPFLVARSSQPPPRTR